MSQVGVGETILVAIAAPHRQEALEACQYAVDRVKQSFLIRERSYRLVNNPLRHQPLDLLLGHAEELAKDIFVMLTE